MIPWINNAQELQRDEYLVEGDDKYQYNDLSPNINASLNIILIKSSAFLFLSILSRVNTYPPPAISKGLVPIPQNTGVHPISTQAGPG